MEGWIKLHRAIQSNDIWNSEPFSRGQAWIDLLLLANHKESFFYKRGNKVTVQRGQVGRSEVELSDRWKWSRTKVRKFLKDLEKEQQIKVTKSRITQVLTIVNYDVYQEKEQQKEQQKDNRKTTKEQQKDTYKNVKKEKNININKDTRIFPDITPQKSYDKNDKRTDKNLPFGMVDASKTLTAIYGLESDSLRKDLIENWGCDSTHDEIKECLYNFTTQYIENPKYEGSSEIRDIEGLKISFIKWIPLCLKMAKQYPTQFKPKKVKRKHDYDLSKYYQANYLPKHFRKITANGQLKADLEQFSNEFENLLAISAKYPTNETFNPMLVFEVLHKPLGRFLHGSTPKRKEASLLRFMEKQSEYNQARGDVRKLLQKEREKQAL